MLKQVGVKQLTDFLRTLTAASDLVDCTLVNCDIDMTSKNFHRFLRLSTFTFQSDIPKINIKVLEGASPAIIKKRDRETFRPFEQGFKL